MMSGFDELPQSDVDPIKLIDLDEHAAVIVINRDGGTQIMGNNVSREQVARHLRLVADHFDPPPAASPGGST